MARKKKKQASQRAFVRASPGEPPEAQVARENWRKSAPTDPMVERDIDEALDESFPSSDPPSWTLGTTRGHS